MPKKIKDLLKEANKENIEIPKEIISFFKNNIELVHDKQDVLAGHKKSKYGDDLNDKIGEVGDFLDTLGRHMQSLVLKFNMK